MANEVKTLELSIPKNTELKYYVGVIDPDEEKDKSTPSDFQWQILKTRFLLQKNPQILAAPINRRPQHIHIIASKEFSSDGSIKKCADNHRLELEGPYYLTEMIYQECLIYSLTFRIASHWPKLENYFVYCTNFLTETKPMEGLKNMFVAADDTFTITMKPQRIKLPLFSLSDLDIDIIKFQATGFASIQKTVYILPHLRKGTAVKICTKIPSNCPFKTYSQLRRHWKNTYGYRLPYDEEGMLFVQVSFNANSTLYSYPVVCVRTEKISALKSRNLQEVTKQFVADLKKKCPAVCGRPMFNDSGDEELYQPTVELSQASKLPGKPNLARATTSTGNVLNETFTQLFNLDCDERKMASQKSAPMKQISSPSSSVPIMPQFKNFSPSSTSTPIKFEEITPASSSASIKAHPKPFNLPSSSGLAMLQSKPIMTQSKKIKIQSKKINPSSLSVPIKIQSKISPPSSVQIVLQPNQITTQPKQTVTQPSSSVQIMLQPKQVMAKSKQTVTQPPSSVQIMLQANQIKGHAKEIVILQKHIIPPTSSLQMPKQVNPTSSSTQSNQVRPSTPTFSSFANMIKPNDSSTPIGKSNAYFVPAIDALTRESVAVNSFPNIPKELESKPLAEIKNLINNQHQINISRPLEKFLRGAEDEPAAKKFRQEYDVETLAHSESLHLLNVPKLVMFCKENQIPVKSKDRKDVIMRKIYNFYGC